MAIPEKLELKGDGNMRLDEFLAVCRMTEDQEQLDQALAIRGIIRASTGWSDKMLDAILLDEIQPVLKSIEEAKAREREEAVPPTSAADSADGPKAQEQAAAIFQNG